MDIFTLPDISHCTKNDNHNTNGEADFYRVIKDKIKVIFDVGSRMDSIFLDFPGTVHYFDPVAHWIDQLKLKPRSNSTAVFNTFGLSDKTDTIYFYPKYEAFHNRVASCGVNDEANKVALQVRDAASYMAEKSVDVVDFLKIDTEGHELQVLFGFGDRLKDVKIVQFEYGGTYVDTKIKLIEVVHYLTSHGFCMFSYLCPNSLVPVMDFTDHYDYCNIVCFNKRFL